MRIPLPPKNPPEKTSVVRHQEKNGFCTPARSFLSCFRRESVAFEQLYCAVMAHLAAGSVDCRAALVEIRLSGWYLRCCGHFLKPTAQHTLLQSNRGNLPSDTPRHRSLLNSSAQLIELLGTSTAGMNALYFISFGFLS